METGEHRGKKERKRGNQKERKGIRRNERACMSMYSGKIEEHPPPILKRRDRVNEKIREKEHIKV